MESKRRDVVALGEAMIRFTPPGNQRLEQAAEFRVYVGGSEANVAVALARLGRSTAWLGRLPQNPLGRRVAAEIASHGVDVSGVVWATGGRVGVYYLEVAGPPRGSRVIYDRQDSAASQLSVGEVDWQRFGENRHLHVSGITVALSPSSAEVVQRALWEAKERGLTVSFDVNYRSRLWSPAEARRALTPLLAVDVVFCTIDDARLVFECEGHPEQVAAALRQSWGAKMVVLTLGGEGSVVSTPRGFVAGRAHPLAAVDRVGAGDAYAAGFLHGFLAGDVSRAVALGGAMAAWKHTEPGDFCYATAEDIEGLLAEEAKEIRR